MKQTIVKIIINESPVDSRLVDQADVSRMPEDQAELTNISICDTLDEI